jgi:hypothetical protein
LPAAAIDAKAWCVIVEARARSINAEVSPNARFALGIGAITQTLDNNDARRP